jgi:hypothetical protein
MAKRIYPLRIALAATLIAAPAIAQTAGTGTIAGTVTDATGAIVPGAIVVITDTDTGAIRNLTTNNDGQYNVTFLQPGHYEVVLGGGSFGKIDRKNLNLTVGQILTIDGTLATAGTTSEVTVDATAPLLDTDKTEVSQTVGQQLISNLPVNARNWDTFVLLTPNVVPDGGSGLVSFHGISGLYNQNYGSRNRQRQCARAERHALLARSLRYAQRPPSPC